MNDEFEVEGQEERDPMAGIVSYDEPVDREQYVAIVHDSFGERYVTVVALQGRGGAVTILRVLGVLELEPRGEVQFFLNGNRVASEHVVAAGDQVYIVGKLAGGR
jgi:hypothetical protein